MTLSKDNRKNVILFIVKLSGCMMTMMIMMWKAMAAMVVMVNEQNFIFLVFKNNNVV